MELPVFDVAEDQKFRIYLVGFPWAKRDESSVSAIVDIIPDLVPEAKVYHHDIFHQSPSHKTDEVRSNRHDRVDIDASEEPETDAGGTADATSSSTASLGRFGQPRFSETWINEQAESLLHRIQRHSQNSRPVLLAGYGFGGFVVKKATVVANTNPQFYDVSLSISSLIFFSTPHVEMPLQLRQENRGRSTISSRYRGYRRNRETDVASGELDTVTSVNTHEDNADNETDANTANDMGNNASFGAAASSHMHWEDTLFDMLKNIDIPHQERLADLLPGLVDGVAQLSHSFVRFGPKYVTVDIVQGHGIKEPHQEHMAGNYSDYYIQWPDRHGPNSLSSCAADSAKEMRVLRQCFAPHVVLSRQILAIDVKGPNHENNEDDDKDDDKNIYLRTLAAISPSHRILDEMHTLEMTEDHSALRHVCYTQISGLAWTRVRGGSVQIIGPVGQGKSSFVKLISQLYLAERTVVIIDHRLANFLEGSRRRSLCGVLESTLQQILSQRHSLFQPVCRMMAMAHARAGAWSTELLAAMLSAVFGHAEGVDFLVVVHDFEKWPRDVQNWLFELRSLVSQPRRTALSTSVRHHFAPANTLVGCSCTFVTSSEASVDTPNGVTVFGVNFDGLDSEQRRKWIHYKTKQLLDRQLKAKAISPRQAYHLTGLITDRAQHFNDPIFSIGAYISYLYRSLGISSPAAMRKVIQASPQDERSLCQTRISALFKNKTRPSDAHDVSWAATVLSWTLLAFRELRVEELAAATAVELHDVQLGDLRENICIDTESDLHFFLDDIITTENKYAHIITPKMRQSLLEDGDHHGFRVTPHRQLAMFCLHYLYIVLHDISPEDWSRCAALSSHKSTRSASADPALEFLNYACRSWPLHFLAALSEVELPPFELVGFVSDTFKSENVFRRWFWLNATFKGCTKVPDDIAAWLEPEKTITTLAQGGVNKEEALKEEEKGAGKSDGQTKAEDEKEKEGSSHARPLPANGFLSSAAFINTLVELGSKCDLAAAEDEWHKWEDDLFGWDMTSVANNDLSHAIARNDPDKIRSLLSDGGTNQCPDFFPLHYAVVVGSVHTIELVTQLVADPAQTDRDGATALHVAAACNRKDALRLLLGDVPSQEDSEAGARDSEVSQAVETEEKNLTKGGVLSIAVANGQDKHSRTALMEATRLGSIDAALFLVQHKVSATFQDTYGQTALHYAVGACPGAVDSLVYFDPGAIFVTDKAKRLPLHYSAMFGNVNAAEVMIRKVVQQKRLTDVCNARDARQYTALDYAAEHGFSDIVHALQDMLDVLGPTFAAAKAVAHGHLDTVPVKGAGTKANKGAADDDDGDNDSDGNDNVDNADDDISEGGDTSAKEMMLAAASRNGQVAAVLSLLKIGAFQDGSEEFRPICLAAIGGYDKVIRVLLRHKADINLGNAKRETALHLASAHRRHVVAEMLLEHEDSVNEANIHLRDDLRQTALHRAQDAFTVRLFLKHGASTDARSSTMATPLHTVVGNAEAVKALLQAQPTPDIDARDDSDRTPLHAAAALGCAESVCVLVKHKAKVDQKDDSGCTALQIAMEGDYLDVVKELVPATDRKHWATLESLQAAVNSSAVKVVGFLLREARDILQPGQTIDDDNSTEEADHLRELQSGLLHAAAAQPSIEVLRLLLDLDLSVDLRDTFNRTPLITAVRNGRTENVGQLIKRHADVAAVDNDKCTALYWAVLGGFAQSAHDLIVAGAPVNAIGYNGRTPLLAAAFGGSLKSVKRLLEETVDIHVTDNDGCCVLHNVGGSYMIAQVLLEHGANVNCRNQYGYYPLHLAASRNHSEIIKALMDYEADPNAESLDGETPFHLAISQNDNSASVEAFLDHKGANTINFNKSSPNKYNSLQLAVQWCDTRILKRLLDIFLKADNKDAIKEGKCIALALSTGMEENLGLLLDDTYISLWSQEDLVDAYWAAIKVECVTCLNALLDKKATLTREKNVQGQDGLQVYLRPRNNRHILHTKFTRALLQRDINPWSLHEPESATAFELGMMMRDSFKDGDFVPSCIEHFPANVLESGLSARTIRVATEENSIALWEKMMPLLSPDTHIYPAADADGDDDGWTLHHILYQALPRIGSLSERITVAPAMYKKDTKNPSAMVVLPEWVRYLNSQEKAVKIGDNGLGVVFERSEESTENVEEDKSRNCRPLTIRANHPLRPRTTIGAYFEVVVGSAVESNEDAGQAAEIAREAGNGRGPNTPDLPDPAIFSIGLVGEYTTMTEKHVGWNQYSIGLHSDDGFIYESGSPISSVGSATYGLGDVIGCGVDYSGVEGHYFFTRNGSIFARRVNSIIYRKLYPAIGHEGGHAVLSINFGAKPFIFKEANKINSVKRSAYSSSGKLQRAPTL